MAWTTPRDWTGISDDIVTAAMLNVDVRDNLLFLGGTSDVTTGHTHTGAAGMGAASMSGLTLTALVNLTFANEGAPTSAGELQRHGNDLKWYGASVVNLTAADQSAGTASLRTLGTTSVKAAAGNHTHEPTSPQVSTADTDVSLDTDTESTVATASFTPGSATLSVAMAATFLLRDGSGNTYTIRLKKVGTGGAGTTTVASATGLSLSTVNLHLLQGLEVTAAETNTYYRATIERTAGSAAFNTVATVVAREVARTT